MRENDSSDQDGDKSKGGQNNGALAYLRGVFIAGAWAFVGLLLVAIFWPNFPQRMMFFIGTLFNLIIAFAVIAQVAIYRRQWQVMERQWRAMEKQTEYGQRAYVFLGASNMDIVEEIETRNQSLVFRFRIDNTGNTPATDVQIVTFSDIVETVPDPVLACASEKLHNIGLIAPRGHTFYWTRAPQPSGEQNKRWVDGELEICCGGLITYNTFGKRRTTKFCVLRKVASMQLTTCGKWNEAD